MITAGIWIIIASLVILTAWLIVRFTRDTGTHAAPRGPDREIWAAVHGRWTALATGYTPDGWTGAQAADPAHWAPGVDGLPQLITELAHEEDWQAAMAERHSGVIVADVYHPTAGPPLDYEPSEPFSDWISDDTFVRGMRAITTGSK